MMKIEDYPEKIYAIYDKECGKWNEFDATAKLDEVTGEFVEYTRSNLIEQLIEDAFERGLIQGIRGGYIIKED